jgi:hypothetical protein
MTSVKGLLLLLLVLVLAVAVLRAIVKIYEPRILFHPEPGLEINPSFAGLEYEDRAIRSGDIFLHAWFYPAKSDRWVVYFKGNGGTIADRIQFVKFLQPLKLNILMVDYRGYGRSEGWPDIESFKKDAVAVAAYAFSVLKAPPDKTVIWGHSLGASAAIHATKTFPGVAGVIAASPFISMRALAHDMLPILPVAFITNELTNAQTLEKLQTPKLIIHGMDDDVIPFRHGEENFRRAHEPKFFFPIPHASHSNLYPTAGEKYLAIVGDFLNKCYGEKPWGTPSALEPSPR